ncbi:hypothetical protein KOM00_14735 [Geomonas sp. Red69]|uniref:hypothetical protein n=1 Tax=Geomonas diazotrophica TaxID=2843197 RepID=UPI001C117393|nr:hypothetical protein [Geomonas diazotrophica]MBU5637983.1 hypothetical protein [Geomonas diazotrophica]
MEYADGTEVLMSTPYVIYAGNAKVTVELPTTVIIERDQHSVVTEIDLPRIEDVEKIDTLQTALAERVNELEAICQGSRMSVPMDNQGVLWLRCEHRLPVRVDEIASTLEEHIGHSRQLFSTIIAEFLVPPEKASHLHLVK